MWLRGYLRGQIRNGRVWADVLSAQLQADPRPSTFEEVGANARAYEMLQNRTDGEFETYAFLGGATALLVDGTKLEQLSEELLKRLIPDKFGLCGELMMLNAVRNTRANGPRNAAEPSGGMAESANLVLERVREIVEFGFYRADGWCRILLPEALAAFQAEFDTEQQFYWDLVRPGFHRTSEAQLELLSVGADSFNGEKGVISVGPVGDLSFLQIAKLNLPGTGWRVLDTECRSGDPKQNEPKWVPLRRRIMGIRPREDKSPVMFEFAAEGGLNEFGLHIPLSGEMLEQPQGVVTHLTVAALRTLGWIK